MSLLILSEIGSLSGQEVLENISLQLQAGDKAGLIGPSRAGRALASDHCRALEPDSGTVSHRGTKWVTCREPGRRREGPAKPP